MKNNSVRAERPQKSGSQQKIVASMVVLTLVAWGCSRPSKPQSSTMETVDAAQILRQMSEKLAKSPQLTFKAKRQLDSALVGDSNMAESAEIEVAILRPNKVQATSTSNAGVRRFYADGQSISMLDESMKLYATVPLSGTIDEMVDKLDEKYGFTPPLAEFVLNDPYQKFSQQIQSSVYRGKETINGVECDHLTLTGEIADADLWVSKTDQLPQRFVATFKDREGSPQLKVDFSEWNLAAKLEESLFIFDPPKGSEKIKMAAIEDVEPDAEKGSKAAK